MSNENDQSLVLRLAEEIETQAAADAFISDSKRLKFEKPYEPEEGTTDGWGINIATIDGTRVKLQCWIDRIWHTKDRHLWAGLSSAKIKPIETILEAPDKAICPTMWLNDADTEVLSNGNWAIKKEIATPRADDLVFESYKHKSDSYLGFYRFDYNVNDLASEVIIILKYFIATLNGNEAETLLKNSTEREALVLARRGQGLYRSRLSEIENKCRLTGVSEPRLLIASHMKPWSRCEKDSERLDGNNGLFLTPTVDRLFDQGFLTFNDDGTPTWSGKLDRGQIKMLNFSDSAPMSRPFNKEQCAYLKFHRENIFKGR